MTQSYIGNFDFLLMSSSTAVNYFININNNIGLQKDCVVGCDIQKLQIKNNNNKNNNNNNFEFNLFSSRVKIPIYLFQIAAGKFIKNGHSINLLL